MGGECPLQIGLRNEHSRDRDARFSNRSIAAVESVRSKHDAAKIGPPVGMSHASAGLFRGGLSVSAQKKPGRRILRFKNQALKWRRGGLNSRPAMHPRCRLHV